MPPSSSALRVPLASPDIDEPDQPSPPPASIGTGATDDGAGKQKKVRTLSDIEESLRLGVFSKRPKMDEPIPAIPLGFLAPLPEDYYEEAVPISVALPVPAILPNGEAPLSHRSSRQFWKAGEFGKDVFAYSSESLEGMDRVRVHPRFLHSNATSHKWALGAFAELLDNALDEVCNGATYVLVDVLKNKKDNSKMLLIEDNGGGMTSAKLRQCMSLGYSAKSKIAHTIGQYGNGFKTSTMRLGADVIVFSRCRGNDGRSASESIGMLSYTFLKTTQKDDIFVPMIDYEKKEQNWERVYRSSSGDWRKNLETILHWSPFTSESDLLKEFNSMKNQGTRIIIYNLWEDDEGELELDFETDPHDIQIRGVNRDKQSLSMAKAFPNSRHYLTYKHSLKSYASILYLRLPPEFRIILRGKDLQHHNIVNDMMMVQQVTYRPQGTGERASNDSGMVATVTIGFVKDAVHHIDIQGFNVYHKNRLIKPFWRVWNAAGSSGRGVIGVLEANFVEPAHDKQGFERTIALSRLETRLVAMQKRYWSENSHRVGYSDKRPKNRIAAAKEDDSLPFDKSKPSFCSTPNEKDHTSIKNYSRELDRRLNPPTDTTDDSGSSEDCRRSGVSQQYKANKGKSNHVTNCSYQMGHLINGNGYNTATWMGMHGAIKLKEEKPELAKRDDETEAQTMVLLNSLTSEKETLEKRLEVAEKKNEKLEKEIEALTDILAGERREREDEEEKLRNKLLDASNTIEELLEKMKQR